MKSKIQILKLALLALLLAASAQSLRAAPPQTGIRGQTLVSMPGFWTEVAPGLWVGVGGFTFGAPASFAVLSAASGHEVARVVSAADGSFAVSLPPGKYVVVPDTLAWSPRTDPFEVTVTAKHQSEAIIYYQLRTVSVTPP
jgi:hypothetical protein